MTDPHPVRCQHLFSKKIGEKIVNYNFGYIAVKEGDLWDGALVAWANRREAELKKARAG